MKSAAAALEPKKKLADKAKTSKPKLVQSSVGTERNLYVAPDAFNLGGAKEFVVPAGKFKATCLALLDRSAKGETITITKYGKIVGRLVPPETAGAPPFIPLLGLMKGKGKILGDIVSPDFEAWGMEDPRKAKKKKK